MKKIFMIFLGCLFLSSAYGMQYEKEHLKLMAQALSNLHPSEEIDFTKTDMAFVAAAYGEFMILKSILSYFPERIKLVDSLAGENIFHFIAEAKYFVRMDEKRQKEKLSGAKGVISFLVSKGLNINLLNLFNQTPLDILEEKTENDAIKGLKEIFKFYGAKTYKELAQEKK